MERDQVDSRFLESCDFATQVPSVDFCGLVVFDDGLLLRAWNPVMEQISGIGAAELLGKNVLTSFPYLVESGDDRLFLDTLQGQHLTCVAHRYKVYQTGRSGFCDARSTPLRDKSKSIVGGVLAVRDVSSIIRYYGQNRPLIDQKTQEQSVQQFSAHLGEAIRSRRLELHLSQEALGDLSGLHRTYITEVERGRRNIGMKNLLRIAQALQQPLWVLLGAADLSSAA